MRQGKLPLVVKGMVRDIAISKTGNEYSYENQNIRLTSRDHDTLLTITNEKGNKELNITEHIGESTVLGHCIINDNVVLFLNYVNRSPILPHHVDTILNISIDCEGNYVVNTLYAGNLNFDTKYPIETIGFYENENIVKVYWTDGLNQPRIINIKANNNERTIRSDTYFDFQSSMLLNEKVTIEKSNTNIGIFAPGVLQYVLTYYRKHRQESNIFHTSPLYYTSFNDRGGSPEDKVSNSFTIKIQNIDPNFDCVRIYSILRTSINDTVEAKRVVDLNITDSTELIFIDNGTTGESIDPTDLLYKNIQTVSFNTFTHKDNTLFLGNIKLQKPIINDSIKEIFQNFNITTTTKDITFKEPNTYYDYKNQLGMNSQQIKTFKYLEYYRLGIQLQDKYGSWSEPIFLQDIQNTLAINGDFTYTSNVDKNYQLPVLRMIINDSDFLRNLASDGYMAIRPVIVYPELQDRECICQGILCPTVFNSKNRLDNAPFVQSSWFTRPNAPFDYTRTANTTPLAGAQWTSTNDLRDRDFLTDAFSKNSKACIINNESVDVNTSGTMTVRKTNAGKFLEFRHYQPIPDNQALNAEIQSIEDPVSVLCTLGADVNDYSSSNANNYYVDQSIVTLHSPDLEFDDNLQNYDFENTKLRIVGMVPITAFKGDIMINTSTEQLNYYNSKDQTPGFYKELEGVENMSRFGWRSLCSGIFWFDSAPELSAIDSFNSCFGYVVYPFHKSGSINNDRGIDNNYISAKLENKVVLNNRFSYSSYYLKPGSIWNAEVENSTTQTGISGVNVVNSNEQILTRIPKPKNSTLPDLNYYGNVDSIITYPLSGDNKKGYDIMISQHLYKKDGSTSMTGVYNGNYVPISSVDSATITKSTTAISMKYKSSIHAVLALNYTENGYVNTLPVYSEYIGGEHLPVNSAAQNFLISHKLYFDEQCRGIINAVINPEFLSDPVLSNLEIKLNDYNEDSVEYGFLWLGELYNDSVVNRFGGQTTEAFENNDWVIGGSSVKINPNSNSLTLLWSEGDTYYQRYDHIKTYPFTQEDENSILDIVSFMCESRTNLDGRYDRNRGQLSNFSLTPTNFNLMNPVYSQYNNFFIYKGLDAERFNIDWFPNTVSWTQEKTPGELVDMWTKLTLANTLDLDGDKGEVRSLNVFNNEIYCFQDSGLSNIIFNARVQINGSDGVPIEIASSGKVQGKRYISNQVGCKNKWSIVESPRGLYFIDNLNTSINLFNGQVNSLSESLGFKTWIKENNSLDIWNPEEYNNFITFYDKTNNDVYFVGKDVCLCYSESLNQFTSFMSYEGAETMFNLKDKFYSVKNKDLWVHEEGDYNMFYGQYQPFSVTYRITPNPYSDKTFTNVEFRSDSWDDDKLTNTTFNCLDVWNEYQSGHTALTMIPCKPSNIQRKFRVWRVNIPRDKCNMMDRIRNPWMYMKLESNKENKLRTQLHDVIVTYYE